MPKVMLSLSNYNKFVDFIGRDWLEENTARYLDKPDGGAHAFVPMHLQMMSYTPLMGSIPKRIYMQQRLCWYQKFSFLGSFVDLVEPLLPNPTRFRRRLRESDQFHNMVFEMLTMGILINGRYQVTKLKEGQHHTPDYLATSPTTRFTVEATRKNTPGKIEDISPYSQKLLDKLAEYLSRSGKSIQIAVSICEPLTYVDNCQKLFELCKEIVERNSSGLFHFCGRNITVLFNSLEKRVYRDFKEFSKANMIFSTLSHNLESLLHFQVNDPTRAIRDIREITLNYEFDVLRSIRSTILNKLRSPQYLTDTPHVIFVLIPLSIRGNYRYSAEELRLSVEDSIGESPHINAVVLVTESFGQLADGAWAYNLETQVVYNRSGALHHKMPALTLAPFERNTIIVTEDEVQVYD